MKFTITKSFALGIFVQLLLGGQSYAQVQPFFPAPASSGVIEVKLYPMENVTSGTPTLVTFGVPFTRGSMLPSEVSKIRVLSGPSSGSTEIAAYVSAVTPWRHATNTAIDGQSVRVVNIQIHHTFSAVYPASESVYIEYGTTARTANVATSENPKTAWHTVTSGSFVAADNIQEPDVYAVLPKEYLTQGALKLTRMLPLDSSIPLTRENPATVDAATYPGYTKHDHGVHNFFFTIANLEPQVTPANQSPYKTQFEPWLYDRTTAMYNLYMRSGNLTVLREAVRNAQFYKSQLYDNTTVPSNAVGVFKLKVPNPNDYVGNNGAMYSYNEGLAYTYWLTGDTDMLAPIEWAVAAHTNNDPPTHWTPTAGSWTERFTSFNLLVKTVAYEVTGSTTHKNAMLAVMDDFIWHQNGAGGALPANRIDGGLYHTGNQHGDGSANGFTASSWMTVLIAQAMIRVYGLTENPEVASFIERVGDFEKVALKEDDEHSYADDYPDPLWYGDYMMLYDGTSDERDGSEAEHAMEITTTLAWAAYFSVLNGNPDPTLLTAANNSYATYNVGFNYWVRPAAGASGLAAYRVNPPRKYGWEYTPSASFTWLMATLNNSSLGVPKVENTDFGYKLYPNPVSDVVTIDNITADMKTVSVTDLNGKLVSQKTLTGAAQASVDVSSLKNGMYLLHVADANGKRQTSKIVVAH